MLRARQPMALLRSRGLAAGIERTVRSRPLQLLARDVRSGRIAASRSSVLASCVVGAQSRKAQFESKRWFSAASDSAPASATSQLKADSSVRITNSVSGRKELLEDDGAGAITWYSCGPTVYDHAHLGHARTYVCMDIAHRILTDVFGRSVVLAMGVTDIDDKIIARAAENDSTAEQLARHFEREFFLDMQALGVRPPAVYLRVSEHVGEIVAYVARIVDNGFAYAAANGDVYFDTAAFCAAKHSFKLMPGGEEEAAAAAAEEGGAGKGGKKHAQDFALWKAAKPGEPKWPSPWGEGRPGWHIECSAMAGTLFGASLSLHSGGVDLKFPHHNNEIAQCEAHNCSHEWAKVWLHTGHLHIAGRKMSKSLKNFISIKDFLKQHSPDEMRMFCLQHKYSAQVDYSPERIAEAARCLAKFDEFFAAVRSCPVSPLKRMEQRERTLQATLVHTQRAVRAALADDFDTPTAVTALLKLVNATNAYMGPSTASAATGGAGTSLSTSTGSAVCGELVRAVAAYAARTLRVFGLSSMSDQQLPLQGAVAASGVGAAGGARDDAAVQGLVDFRTRVRQRALALLKASPDSAEAKELLAECDRLREVVLLEMRVVLTDDAKGGSESVWRWMRSGEYEAHQTDMLRAREARARLSQVAHSVVPPAEAIRAETVEIELDNGEKKTVPKYTQFDDNGMPTHDAKGAPLSKSGTKTAVKTMNKLQTKYDRYVALTKQAKPTVGADG